MDGVPKGEGEAYRGEELRLTELNLIVRQRRERLREKEKDEQINSRNAQTLDKR